MFVKDAFVITLLASLSLGHPASMDLAPSGSCPAGNPHPSYTIEKGDTCISISTAAGISTLDLEALNCLDSTCSIKAGDNICLPPQCNAYLVKSGDKCNDIASANGLQPNVFFGYNPGLKKDCSNLEAGTNVCLNEPSKFPRPTCTTSGPSSSSSANPPQGSIAAGTRPDCAKLYTVQSGDTCKVIADKYGITVDIFFSLNLGVHNPSCDNVIAGDRYCVAAQGSSATGTASAGYPTSTGGSLLGYNKTVSSGDYTKRYSFPLKARRL